MAHGAGRPTVANSSDPSAEGAHRFRPHAPARRIWSQGLGIFGVRVSQSCSAARCADMRAYHGVALAVSHRPAQGACPGQFHSRIASLADRPVIGDGMGGASSPTPATRVLRAWRAPLTQNAAVGQPPTWIAHASAVAAAPMRQRVLFVAAETDVAFRQEPGRAGRHGCVAVSADQPTATLSICAASANPFSWARSELDLRTAAATPQRRYIAVTRVGEEQGEAHHDGGAIQNRCQQTSFMRAEITIQAIQCPRPIGTDSAQRRLSILQRQPGKVSPQPRDRPLPRSRIEVRRARRHE